MQTQSTRMAALIYVPIVISVNIDRLLTRNPSVAFGLHPSSMGVKGISSVVFKALKMYIEWIPGGLRVQGINHNLQ